MQILKMSRKLYGSTIHWPLLFHCKEKQKKKHQSTFSYHVKSGTPNYQKYFQVLAFKYVSEKDIWSGRVYKFKITGKPFRFFLIAFFFNEIDLYLSLTLLQPSIYRITRSFIPPICRYSPLSSAIILKTIYTLHNILLELDIKMSREV